jgi:hypothetical protein
MVFNEAISAMHRVILCTLSIFFATKFFRVLTWHELVVVFVQGRVLKKLCVGIYRLIQTYSWFLPFYIINIYSLHPQI